MNQSSSESIEIQEKIKQQYDFLPYPESDIDFFPENQFNNLFIHSLVTPYYLRYQQVINTTDKLILDAGCGSGLKALTLALTNPGAKIVGVDISPKSVELARQRFAYHGFKNAEFHTLSLENIESLGYQFDYINCDEVLYLLDNPTEILTTFRSILTPRGIIRTNLHSYYQRNAFFRIQEAFNFLGLFDESKETAIEVAEDTLDRLKDSLEIKKIFKQYESLLQTNPKKVKEWILVNYLLQGDKGYTIEQMFDFLASAELDFLSMVNWRQWDIYSIFKKPEDLPLFWQFTLDNASESQKLQLFELFAPIHRLLDFWAIQPDDTHLPDSPINWDDSQWQSCRIHLHPALAKDKVKNELEQAIANRENFILSKYISLPTLKPVMIDSGLGACLLPLWESSQSFSDLVKRWLLIQQRNPLTLELKTETHARGEIQALLTKLETFTYLLLEI